MSATTLVWLLFAILILILVSAAIYLAVKHLPAQSSANTRSLLSNQPEDPTSKIFVSIASYRDKECPATLREVYQKAKYPQRIFVGICQQNRPQDLDCVSTSVPVQNVRYIKLAAEQARGPCLARYHCSKLYQGEDFYFQVDSHTKFDQDWDIRLISMYNVYRTRLQTHKIVLSAYPLDWNMINQNQQTVVFCENIFNDQGLIQPMPQVIQRQDPTKWMIEHPIAAGGMMFGPGTMVRDVPYDPDLLYLFHGEELLYSVRLWAEGYKILCPSENVVYHYYTRADEPKVWGDDPEFNRINPMTVAKVKRSLLLDGSSGPGVTLPPPPHKVQEYYQYFGINLAGKSVRKRC